MDFLYCLCYRERKLRWIVPPSSASLTLTPPSCVSASLTLTSPSCVSASLTLTPPSCVSASCYAAILLPLRCRFAPSCAHIFLGKFFFSCYCLCFRNNFFCYFHKISLQGSLFCTYFFKFYFSDLQVWCSSKLSLVFFLRGQSAVANEISKSGFPHFISECSSQWDFLLHF